MKGMKHRSRSEIIGAILEAVMEEVQRKRQSCTRLFCRMNI